MTGGNVTKIYGFKFDYQWGGEDTWFTKASRWASKQKFPISYIAHALIEWLWEGWVDAKVERQMDDVNKQVEDIMEEWSEEDVEPTIKSEPSEVEGLDVISTSWRPKDE